MQSEFYKKYIVSDAWRQKAMQRKKVDGFMCVCCGRPESRTRGGLVVHHINYRNLGNEDVANDLVTLCMSCHQKIHRYYDRRRSGCAEADEYQYRPFEQIEE